MNIITFATQITSPLMIGVCVFLLIKYLPVAVRFEHSARWWLIFGIVVSFFGQLLCSVLRSAIGVELASVTDSVVVGRQLGVVSLVSQLFTVVSGVCHLIAVTVYIGRRVSWLEICLAGLISSLIMIFLWFLR